MHRLQLKAFCFEKLVLPLGHVFCKPLMPILLPLVVPCE